MAKSNKPAILVLISNPFAMLNVVHSGLLAELSKTYRISVLSDFLKPADIIRFNAHFDLNMSLLPISLPHVFRPERWLRAVQTVLFGYFFDLDTLWLKVLERRLLSYLLHAFRDVAIIRVLAGCILMQISKWLRFPSRSSCYACYNFRAVISASPLDLRENKIANALKAHGVPCIAMIISWDNLSSKGVINMHPDLVLVWSNAMAKEYKRLYGAGCVRVTGVPRFDIYHTPLAFKCRALLQMPDRAQVILFATGAVKHHRCQNYIIDDLLDYAKSRRNVFILVRCHPGDDPQRYKRYLGCRNLLVFQPVADVCHAPPPVDYLKILQEQLAICRVCIQVASTMFLDAAACSRPAICIGYDAQPRTPYPQSVRRFYDYSHHLPLHGALEKHMAWTKAELHFKLDEILTGPSDRTDLWQDIEPVVQHFNGGSVAVTAQCIRECLG